MPLAVQQRLRKEDHLRWEARNEGRHQRHKLSPRQRMFLLNTACTYWVEESDGSLLSLLCPYVVPVLVDL